MQNGTIATQLRPHNRLYFVPTSKILIPPSKSGKTRRRLSRQLVGRQVCQLGGRGLRLEGPCVGASEPCSGFEERAWCLFTGPPHLHLWALCCSPCVAPMATVGLAKAVYRDWPTFLRYIAALQGAACSANSAVHCLSGAGGSRESFSTLWRTAVGSRQ